MALVDSLAGERRQVSLTTVLILLLPLVVPATSRSQSGAADAPLAVQLREAFRGTERSRPDLPLLDAGSVLHRDTVRALDGSAGSPVLDRLGFIGAYGDLAQAVGGEDLPPVDRLLEAARRWRQEEGATPIAVAVVDYETVPERVARQAALDRRGRIVLPRSGAPSTVSGRLVAAGVQADRLPAWNPRLVVPAELVVLGSGEPARLERLTVRANGGAAVPVELDRPFVPRLESWRDGPLELELEIGLDGRRWRARTVVQLEGARWRPEPGELVSKGGQSSCPIECWDLPPVAASIPWPHGSDRYGLVRPRIYPAHGTVERVGGALVPKLRRVLVLVDGFDAFNQRTQDDVWIDFGEGIEAFVRWGFDVVVPDYDNGRDWIERNGYALRELLVEVLPGWMEAGYEEVPVAMVSGSMGGQTGRWALRTAELGYPDGDPEDHRVELFVAIDSPWHGAHIPISLQALVDFLGEESADAREFTRALDSPAARQQLRLTRRVGARVPTFWDYVYGNPLASWYVQSPDGAAYYEFVDRELGLPERSRNVGYASGSGTGQLQFGFTDPFGEGLYVSVEHRVLLGILGKIELWTTTDRDGQVFHGFIRKFLKKRRGFLWLDRSQYLDLVPADTRSSPRQIADFWNASDDAPGTMKLGFARHGYTPTFSTLYAGESDFYWDPSLDPWVEDRVPFDNFFYEKCNRGHVEGTSRLIGFLRRELIAFRDGLGPPDTPRFREPCGSPEPRDLCLGFVTWLADPDAPFDIDPWYDGANCYVKPVPGGYQGFVRDNAYHVWAEGRPCEIGIATTVDGSGACRLGEAPRETEAFEYRGAFYYTE